MSQQAKNIQNHQAEGENIKRMVAEKQHENIRVMDDIANTKAQADQKESELYQLRRDQENLRGYNEQLKKEVDYLQHQEIYNNADLRKRQ